MFREGWVRRALEGGRFDVYDSQGNTHPIRIESANGADPSNLLSQWRNSTIDTRTAKTLGKMCSFLYDDNLHLFVDKDGQPCDDQDREAGAPFVWKLPPSSISMEIVRINCASGHLHTIPLRLREDLARGFPGLTWTMCPTKVLRWADAMHDAADSLFDGPLRHEAFPKTHRLSSWCLPGQVDLLTLAAEQHVSQGRPMSFARHGREIARAYNKLLAQNPDNCYPTASRDAIVALMLRTALIGVWAPNRAKFYNAITPVWLGKALPRWRGTGFTHVVTGPRLIDPGKMGSSRAVNGIIQDEDFLG